jgi:hypothetical protein
MVNILDGLIILAVHVENVQERLVDVLITLEPALYTRGNKPIMSQTDTYIYQSFTRQMSLCVRACVYLDLVDEIDGFHEINRLLLLVILQPDCKALGQEGVESEDELRVPVEKGLDTDNYPVGINPASRNCTINMSISLEGNLRKMVWIGVGKGRAGVRAPTSRS